MTISIVLVIAGFAAGWWLLWRVPFLVDDPRPGAEGRRAPQDVAVVIPARDEADTLPHLLKSLAAQTEPAREIVVVDDGSLDDTSTVARAHGATVLIGRALPPGWTGKAWACQQGANASTAARLVFLDADVRLEPDALRALAAAHDSRGGLLSVAPFHRMPRWRERLSAPFNLVAFMGVGAASPWRRGRSDGAFGPCMVCRRTDYDAIGGHASVRSTVTEDLALAQAFTDARMPTSTLAGRGLVEYRMYPLGLHQLVEGWSKNLASGARFVPAIRSLLVGLWITGLLVVAQHLALALWAPSRTHVAVVALGYGAFVVQQRARLGALTDGGWLTAALFPLTTLFFATVFMRSLWWTVVRRRVRWRGRDIPLAPATTPLDLRPEV